MRLDDKHTIPFDESEILSGDPERLGQYMKQLIKALRSMYFDIANVVNSGVLQDTNGNYSIGVDVPLGKLHIKTGSAGSAPTVNAAADELVLEGSDNTGFTILCPNDKIGSIFFADEDSAVMGAVQYLHTTNDLTLATSGVTKVTISSSGDATMASGTLVLADGGTITQITSRFTAVTLNTHSGQITTDTTTLLAGAEATFTVNNSVVTALDTIIVNAASGQTSSTIPLISAVAAGSFNITLTNLHASASETGAIVINFVVLRGASS